ncbi:UDP-N-acetylglucosamine 2-epimerase [Cetobacterium somerae]|uniref:UDP-N-acetylglucosamine 2-epimerase n=1 Tax=Cetobacterium somerae TaxID=188913 RepID=UPI00248EAB8E|nr:UDP-N-acetylglucosamine 2-epimerase [Cetobacterium somerae]
MKKLAYITGSRAEYGIMKRLLKKIYNSNEIELTIVATGMQVDEKYGNTYKVIEEDGFKIDKLIDIKIDNSDNSKILNSMSICQSEFGKYFQEKKFDAVMILGDRYEIFSVAIAAAMHNIPLIHLHGGEKTLGNYDEFIRHAITKMSKLHLVSTEEYRKRVIQMGENPKDVFNVGALGAENSFEMVLPEKNELQNRFGTIKKDYFMVVFHPETVTGVSIENQIEELLNAIDNFKGNYDFIFIGSNSDTGSDTIFRMINNYTRKNNFKFLTSVKPEEYLALIKYSKGLIGNSSSGLIEVPSLKIATINIGDRQKGRVRGESVIDAQAKKHEIIEAIECSQSTSFKDMLKNTTNPYYQKEVMEEAYKIIKEFLNSDRLKEIKDFYDF